MTPSAESHYRTNCFSHTGYVRAKNEDRYSIAALPPKPSHPEGMLIAVLADGVGGHRDGEVAAAQTIASVQHYFEELDTLQDPQEALRAAVLQANRAVWQIAQADAQNKGMACTCVCALLNEKNLTIANVGDSRIYLWRDNAIVQLTHDHTWLAEFQHEQPLETSILGRSHPFAHVLSRYIGTAHAPEVDLRMQAPARQGLALRSGDGILLCSDGLTDMVSNQEIAGVLAQTPFAEAAQALVQHALDAGGKDNTTVVLVQKK